MTRDFPPDPNRRRLAEADHLLRALKVLIAVGSTLLGCGGPGASTEAASRSASALTDCGTQYQGCEQRDANGCCAAPLAAPPVSGHDEPNAIQVETPVLAPTLCEAGKETGPKTAGHCCWKGQRWSSGRCVGAPSWCPDQQFAKGDDCELTTCNQGRERTGGSSGHCCWPGQAWSASQHSCIGQPSRCPDGYTAIHDECLAPVEWMSIPAGVFTMGSNDPNAFASEKPHRVSVGAYRMARTETTVFQYSACVAANACTPPRFSQKGQNYPVVSIDWAQADRFCRWAGGHLPTEAEWEYAARGTDGRLFPWGNSPPLRVSQAVANFDLPGYVDGYDGLSPVGSFSYGRSPFGLDDMAGNVWEWVSDWFGGYEISAFDNPVGPSEGSLRVLRGGGIDYIGWGPLRATFRRADSPRAINILYGFRCARRP